MSITMNGDGGLISMADAPQPKVVSASTILADTKTATSTQIKSQLPLINLSSDPVMTASIAAYTNAKSSGATQTQISAAIVAAGKASSKAIVDGKTKEQAIEEGKIAGEVAKNNVSLFGVPKMYLIGGIAVVVLITGFILYKKIKK